MARLSILAATLAILTLAPLTAQAQGQGGNALGTAAHNFTPVQSAACHGWGRFCGPGFVRRCWGWRCRCVPCW